MSTACVYLHRFYMFESFERYDRFVMSVGCLYLAGKAEECQRDTKSLAQGYITYMNSRSASKEMKSPAAPVADIDVVREQIVRAEAMLLQTLFFEVEVQHPYGDCVHMIQSMLKGEKETKILRALNQDAVNFINDSYSTTICLRHRSQAIAAAALALALVHLDLKPCVDALRDPTSCRQWLKGHCGDVCLEELRQASSIILQLYSPKPAQTPSSSDAFGDSTHSLALSSNIQRIPSVLSSLWAGIIPSVHNPPSTELGSGHAPQESKVRRTDKMSSVSGSGHCARNGSQEPCEKTHPSPPPPPPPKRDKVVRSEKSSPRISIPPPPPPQARIAAVKSTGEKSSSSCPRPPSRSPEQPPPPPPPPRQSTGGVSGGNVATS